MIPPPCQLCAGACCEFIRVPDSIVYTDDDKRWLHLHDLRRVFSDIVYLPAACSELENGLCSIYPNRPQCCKDFRVGGGGCREAIRVRRGEREKEIVALL